MTLKECFFLLNEENYKNTNIFKFRSEFRNIPGKNNENFLKESKEGDKIFGNLFSQYYSIYEENSNIKQDFIIKKLLGKISIIILIKNMKHLNAIILILMFPFYLKIQIIFINFE